MTETVADALTSAGIPESKVGQCRGGRLGSAERELYVWMLQGFAQGSPPSANAIRTEVTRLGLDPDQTRHRLATEDLIHFDGEGRSRLLTRFRANRRSTAYALRALRSMPCAIDALGVAPMFKRPIFIDSSDPLTNAKISIWLQPDGTGTWQPKEAGVVTGRACADGAAFEGCCQVLNFFASRENAERYLLEHGEASGFPITMPHAIEVGRAIFGAVLKDD